MRVAFSQLLTVLFCFLLPASGLARNPGFSLTPLEQDYLEKHSPILFVSQINYPPFEFLKQDGTHDGMTIELVRWLATEIGFRAEFAHAPFVDAQRAVLENRADVLTSLFYSDKRDEVFDFSEPLFEVPASIFVTLERPDIVRLEDLANKRIAIQRGDYAKDFLEEKQIPVQLVATEDFFQATDAIISGQADAIIGDEQIVLYHLYSNGLNDRVKKVGEPLYTGIDCFAVKQGNTVLQGILNKGIAHAATNGVIEKLNRKWIGTIIADETDYWAIIWPILSGAAVLLLLFGAWNVRLRRSVEQKTADLAESEENYRRLYQNTRVREQRLNYALSAANDGLWDWNPQTNDVFYSQRWQTMLGYETGEIEPKFSSWINLLHPDDMVRADGAVKDHLAGRCPEINCTFRMAAKDGSWRWILSRGQVVEKNSAGQPIRVVGTHQDITQQKEVEDQLRLSEERYRQLVVNLKDVIFQTDADGLWSYLNPAWEEITGFTAEESLGTLFLNYIHPEDRERNQILFAPMIAGEKDYCRHEIRYLRKDGNFRWILVFARLTRNEQGEIIGTTGTLSDITERKLAEQRLELQGAALNAAANAMLITDQDGHIEWANPAFCQVTGYAEKEIIGQRPQDLVRSGHQSEKFYQLLWQTILSGQPWQGELINRRKDGSTYHEELTITPVDLGDGDNRHFIAVMQDISGRKQLEKEKEQATEQFYHAQKLDSLGRLAGGIAHDLNNLLVPVIVCPKLIEKRLPRELEQIQPLLKQIESSGQRAADLVSQILAFGRRQHLDKKILDANQVLLALEPLLESLMESKIEFEFEMATDLPAILADNGQLEQALINLSINGKESMPDGGRLNLSTYFLHNDQVLAAAGDQQLEPGDYVCFAVSDSGHGIDSETRRHILEPFYTTKAHGTGLGLSTVVGIVEQHGGALLLETKPGKGTTFTLCFPATQIDHSPIVEVRSQVQDFIKGKEMILLVDDQEVVRGTVREILEQAGYRVLEGEGGLQAKRILENSSGRIDLLLSDVTMPQMNGYELGKWCRQHRPQLPILFMSGFEQPNLVQLSSEETFHYFIQKPFQAHDLLKMLRKILDN